MATQPTNDLLVWANTDVNLPNLAGPNKTEPSADLVAKGWDFKQKPSADEFNYILNNLGEWVEYLKTVVIEATPEATANTLALRDTNGSFKVKQLISTAPNGITPLVVTSTTKVNNLNADLLDGMNPTSVVTPSTVCSRDGNGDVAARYFVGNLNGNADTTTKWKTARTLTATGFATGTATGIDGSGNISLELSMGSGFTNSKTQNGYTYLPNGVIMQWGYAAIAGVGTTRVTFPVSFPNVCFQVFPTLVGVAEDTITYAKTSSSTNGGAVILVDANNGTGVSWFAIGY